MERFTDLAIVLKSFVYQERDRIAVCLTQNHGRITGLAKGGVHSKRFGGTLDFLACSRVQFVQKPHAEMARFDEATSHHEFRNLAADFERLTVASFVAEFCLKLIEPRSPAREMFTLLSNTLFQLDQGMTPSLVVNIFLCKAFKAMGYPPSLLRCVQCARGAHEITTAFDSGAGSAEPELFFWYSESGGMICRDCAKSRFKVRLDFETLLYFHKLTMTPVKELADATGPNTALYRLLSDFLHHHIPGLPVEGLKSWKLLNDALGTSALPERERDGEFNGLS